MTKYIAVLLVVLILVACAQQTSLQVTPTHAPPTETATFLPSTGTAVPPTDTPLPTDTPVPASTPTATPTPDYSTCKLGCSYVSDITIQDNTSIGAGKRFIKTWELKNTGDCTWGDGCYLKHVDGQAMSAVGPVQLPAIEPGKVAKVSVPMKAPMSPGTYRSYWQLCVGEHCFGERIYVQIITPRPRSAASFFTPEPATDLTYMDICDKREALTDAQWSAYANSLAGQRIGWVGYVHEVWENGRVQLSMRPGVVFIRVPKKNVLKYNKEQRVSFRATIKSVEVKFLNELFGGVTVELENVVVMEE